MSSKEQRGYRFTHSKQRKAILETMRENLPRIRLSTAKGQNGKFWEVSSF